MTLVWPLVVVLVAWALVYVLRRAHREYVISDVPRRCYVCRNCGEAYSMHVAQYHGQIVQTFVLGLCWKCEKYASGSAVITMSSNDSTRGDA